MSNYLGDGIARQAEGTYFGPDADVDAKIKAAIARAEGTK